MVAYTCNPRTEEAEAGRSGVSGHPELHSKFQTSLSYIVRPCLKTTTKTDGDVIQ
jgi:hypothetical protein